MVNSHRKPLCSDYNAIFMMHKMFWESEKPYMIFPSEPNSIFLLVPHRCRVNCFRKWASCACKTFWTSSISIAFSQWCPFLYLHNNARMYSGVWQGERRPEVDISINNAGEISMFFSLQLSILSVKELWLSCDACRGKPWRVGLGVPLNLLNLAMFS